MRRSEVPAAAAAAAGKRDEMSDVIANERRGSSAS